MALADHDRRVDYIEFGATELGNELAVWTDR